MSKRTEPSLATRRLAGVDQWLSRRGDYFWALMILALGLIIYLPRLGAFPLWDPWEPHYTQVAWEMQERLTWNNPWYRGIDNWWSKPILMLWMLRLSLGAFWDQLGDFASHEWAARLPFALSAIAGGLLHFDWVRRLYGRRVGVLAALILITAPQYVLVGRQVMADVPFLVAYGASLGYLAVGLFATPGPCHRTHPAGRWLHQQWPFLLFWVLQALSVLAKGFVAPTLAALILVAYWAATFRWKDFRDSLAQQRWLRYFLIRGGIALALAGLAFGLAYFVPGSHREQRALYQVLIGGTAGLGIALGVFHQLPPFRHALRLLIRVRIVWGLGIFLLVAAPWFVFMTVKHGWPYWNEFIFYHHLGRAAGTIDKPNATFEYFVKQMAFAVFPWTAFTLAAFWQFLSRASPMRSIANRRNLFVLLATVIPFLFFALSGTKFAHYIMPVVPLFSVMIAATLIWLGREPEAQLALAESSPAVGPSVPAFIDTPQKWWEKKGARGDLLVCTAVALVTFGILSHDLVLDFRNFLRLFIYYYNRETPFDYQPFVILQTFFFPLGITIGFVLFARWIHRWHLSLFSLGALVLACYIGWFMMPAMKDTYSFKPFLRAYEELAKPGEPIGQYNDWQQPVRSVIFLFQNRCVHLRTDQQAKAFLNRPNRKFIMIDRSRLADLRRVAKEAGKKLYVVFDDHPYGRMVSDQPNPSDTRKAAAHILKEPPADMKPLDANFEEKIQMIGWILDPPEVKRGTSTRVSFYYRCLQVMDRDWQIFIHGDGPSGGSHRLHLDHFPVEGLYPTTEWQEDEIVRDTFAVNVPVDYPFDYFYLWTGWYIGNQRLRLSNNPPNDGQNRVRGPRISVQRD